LRLPLEKLDTSLSKVYTMEEEKAGKGAGEKVRKRESE